MSPRERLLFVFGLIFCGIPPILLLVLKKAGISIDFFSLWYLLGYFVVVAFISIYFGIKSWKDMIKMIRDSKKKNREHS